MKTIPAFLAGLSEQDIRLWAEGDRLRINAPKGAITLALKDEIAERKAEILAFLASQTVNPLTIQPVPRTDVPLSLAQERIWFLEQLEASNVYNLEMILRFTGTLQFDLLERAIATIIQRHESLRTTFTAIDGIPVQVIAADLKLSIPVIDLQPLSEPEQQVEVDRLIEQEAHAPFDLEKGPLVRVTLLQLAPQSHVLLLAMHHIIADGWSIGIFIQELSVLYDAFLHGQTSPLPELPIQYADFAVWQRQWLQGSVLEAKLSYWQRQLQDAPPLLELPTDRPRPSVQTFRGSTIEFRLSPELTQNLKALSQRSKVTSFMTLLAAFAVLLYRYSRQVDICIGSSFANRTHDETRSLIGLFLNTLVFRIRLHENPTFTEVLTRVKQVALEAYDHQDVPFEKLVETLPGERDLSHSPWFQVLFILLNIPPGGLNTSELTLTSRETRSAAAKFDLTLTMAEVASGMQAMWEYNTDLFESATINRMTEHFQTLLSAVVADPEQRISALPLLTTAEQDQLMQWSRSTLPVSLSGSSLTADCIHHLFEAQVEQTPDAVAVQFEDQQLTYRELNQRANQLAHEMQSRGVEPETLVGLCVDRSIEMVIGLMAVLKAGGAYVPLDPNYPADRLAYILEDAQVSVLLTQQCWLEKLPQINGTVLCLDADHVAICPQNLNNPDTSVAADHLAYVIYTSGSTGEPKGVQLQHRSVVNFLTSMQCQPGLTAEDVLLSVTTISFDIAALEIFLPLSVGACVVLVSTEVATDGFQLLFALNRFKATVMQATPSTWRLLITAGWQGSPNLKILCGGEALPQSLANQLMERGASLWNLYGPTETTIWSSIYQIEAQNAPILLGKPIANTQMYVLDTHLHPVPIGVPGELYIGGDGLARSYFNRPQLTAERFIPDPFRDRPGSRLYKTGDLVRYRPDGNLEFLGRMDHQVKLRGFRIELGEIEAVLSQTPGVHQAVTIVRADQPGDKQLVAYLVPQPGSDLSVEDLRQHLFNKLPYYMVPTAFVLLEALPLTPNGKINRRALPAPDWTNSCNQDDFVAPRNSTEQQLAEIWAEVLGLRQVSIYDRFFDLGGHSLLATQVLSRIRDSFALELPLRVLFASPTIASLAEQIVLKQLEQVNQTELERLLAEVDLLSDETVQYLLTEF